MTIRPMTEKDIPKLVEMGAKAHMESQYKGMKFIPEKFRSFLCQFIGNVYLLCIVAVKDEEIIGAMAGQVDETYFSNELTASDLFVYISPEHRGSRAFYLLCSEYIAWARQKQGRMIFLANTYGYESEKVGDIYQRIGFEQIGGIYRQEVSYVRK